MGDVEETDGGQSEEGADLDGGAVVEVPAAEGDPRTHPSLVSVGAHNVGQALEEGTIVALPAVGGYCLAVQVGAPGAEARLASLAADPDGPHYAVGHRDEVRALTSGWSDEVERLLERCWPGPVDVFLPRAAAADTGNGVDGAEAGEDESNHGGWAVTVGMPDGRALRRL